MSGADYSTTLWRSLTSCARWILKWWMRCGRRSSRVSRFLLITTRRVGTGGGFRTGCVFESPDPPRDALDYRTHQLVAVQLRATPPQHRPPHPAPTSPTRPRHRPPHRQTHRPPQPLEPRPMSNPRTLLAWIHRWGWLGVGLVVLGTACAWSGGSGRLDGRFGPVWRCWGAWGPGRVGSGRVGPVGGRCGRGDWRVQASWGRARMFATVVWKVGAQGHRAGRRVVVRRG